MDIRRPNFVYKLNKTLYSLNQAVHGIYEVLIEALGRIRLHPFRTEPAVFSGNLDGCNTCVVALVDDLLIISATELVV